MNIRNYLYINKIKLSYIIFFAFIWLSIDTNFENSIHFFKEQNFRNFIVFLRSNLVFVIFLLIFGEVLTFIKKDSNLKLQNNVKLVILIFISYLILQLIGHIHAQNNWIYIYYFFLSLFLIIYITRSFTNNLIDYTFYISLFFLFLIFLIFGFLSIKYFFTNGALTFYGTFPHVYKSMLSVTSNVVRSSGLSRTSMLLYIPLIIYLFNSTISKKHFLLLFLITFIMLLTQSRLTSLFWIGFLIFLLFFYFKNKKIFFYFKKILILFVIPMLLIGFILGSKFYIFAKGYILTDQYNNIVGINKELLAKDYNIVASEILSLKTIDPNDPVIDVDKKIYRLKREIDPLTFSSGRTDYWEQILSRNKNHIIGNGFLGDRYLINNNNASNIIFYTYASGGVLGSILILLLISRCVYICIDLIFLKKISFEKKNFILLTSIFYLSFLVFRGIGENSFAVFSIDQIIFIQSLLIVEFKRNEIIKKKY